MKTNLVLICFCIFLTFICQNYAQNDTSKSPKVILDIPIGTIVAFVGDKDHLPSCWALCDGRKIRKSDEDFTALYNIITNKFGEEGEYYYLPDFRGMFLRGAEKNERYKLTNNELYDGGKIGSFVQDQFQGHWHSPIGGDGIGWTNKEGFDEGRIRNAGKHDSEGHWISEGDWIVRRYRFVTRDPASDGKNDTPRIGVETKPASISVNYIIKYK